MFIWLLLATNLLSLASGDLLGHGILVHSSSKFEPEFVKQSALPPVPIFKHKIQFPGKLLEKALLKIVKPVAENRLETFVTPLALLYTGALLWKEFSPKQKPRPERKRRKKKEKTEKEKQRMETMKKEQKLELSREIMGIHADILRLIAYTTATGTQTLELANNLRKDLRRPIPGGKRKKQRKEEELDAADYKLNSTLSRLRNMENVLKKLAVT